MSATTESEPPVLEVSTSSRRRERQTAPDSSVPAPGKSEVAHPVHCVLQAKGGVGKSFVASLIVQWHQHIATPVAAFDTDPMNHTLMSVPGLNATHIELLNRDALNVDGVDDLMERIITHTGPVAIDNGAASFYPMANYLLSNGIAFLQEHQRRMVVHTVVAGGQPAADTLAGMVALLEQFPTSVPVVVWVNEHDAPFEADGAGFEQTRAYQANVARIAGIIRLPTMDPRTHGRDVAMMLSQRLTFSEAIASDEFRLVAKSRLNQVRAAVFEQMDVVMGAV